MVLGLVYVVEDDGVAGLGGAKATMRVANQGTPTMREEFAKVVTGLLAIVHTNCDWNSSGLNMPSQET